MRHSLALTISAAITALAAACTSGSAPTSTADASTPDASTPPLQCPPGSSDPADKCVTQGSHGGYLGLSCCNGVCVNERNDPLNCGGCGIKCVAPTSMCQGHCIVPTCMPACESGSQCCLVNGSGPPRPPACYDAGSTCPPGCPNCT